MSSNFLLLTFTIASPSRNFFSFDSASFARASAEGDAEQNGQFIARASTFPIRRRGWRCGRVGSFNVRYRFDFVPFVVSRAFTLRRRRRGRVSPQRHRIHRRRRAHGRSSLRVLMVRIHASHRRRRRARAHFGEDLSKRRRAGRRRQRRHRRRHGQSLVIGKPSIRAFSPRLLSRALARRRSIYLKPPRATLLRRSSRNASTNQRPLRSEPIVQIAQRDVLLRAPRASRHVRIQVSPPPSHALLIGSSTHLTRDERPLGPVSLL